MTFLVRSLVVACLLFVATIAGAQTLPAPTNTAAAPADQGTSSQTLKTEELDQLTAPIALYPDPLLSNVLMASTYPLELIAADRWVKATRT
jgi:hypothetical protein